MTEPLTIGSDRREIRSPAGRALQVASVWRPSQKGTGRRVFAGLMLLLRHEHNLDRGAKSHSAPVLLELHECLCLHAIRFQGGDSRQRHTGLHHRPSSVRRYSLLAFAFTIPQSSSTLVLSSPDIETGTEYTVYTGETASGDEFYGLYLGDLSYSQGTAGSSFTVSSSVTNVGGTQMEGPGGPGTRPGM
jgi:hypothetical protein